MRVTSVPARGGAARTRLPPFPGVPGETGPARTPAVTSRAQPSALVGRHGTHSSGHAAADDGSVLVYGVPRGELAGTKLAHAVFSTGGASRKESQETCLLSPAASVKLPAACEH
ncbi:hypothetical protein [Streptomyces sp. NPDC021020]|uniref:hypothetical protein n=1 Tax=Streptomyces sp. NPDC021020 TaxID=3365109 RepID=UPI0037B48A15